MNVKPCGARAVHGPHKWRNHIYRWHEPREVWWCEGVEPEEEQP